MSDPITFASVRAMLDDREAPRALEAARDDDGVWCIYDHKARRIALCEPECGWYARLFAAAPSLAAAYLAAMERVAELERLQASIHKAAAAGRDAERRAVVAHLRVSAEEGGDPWMATAIAAIERGEHRERK